MTAQNCEYLYSKLSELEWKLKELESSIGWANQSINEVETAIGWKLQELEELKRTRQERCYEKESIAQNINAVKQAMQQIKDALWYANC